MKGTMEEQMKMKITDKVKYIGVDDTTIDFGTGEYTAHVTFVPDKKNKGQYFRFGAVAVKYVK